jgi:succinyl-diaminopimelate desuccinylase
MSAPFDPVALTQALIRCESVTPAEGGALTLLEGLLTGAGFTCHRITFRDVDTPDVDNLYARFGTHGRNLCFAGHTDVVPIGDAKSWTSPPFGAEIRDGILYGRGAVDMKGGVACFVAAALRHLAANPQPQGSLSFLITGDEEGPSINGTMKLLQWLAERDERLDACLVGEPSNPQALGDEIKIGRRGSVVGHLVVHGKQGHAAYPQKADNPVPKLARLIDRLSTQTIDKGTPHFQPSNLQVTVIDVPNTASNVIPAEARAVFNIRYNDIWNRPRIEEWVRLQLDAAADGRDIRYDVRFSGTGDVFLTEPGPLVDTLVAAVSEVTGHTPQRTTGGGTSDARFIKDYCPVIEFGLVNKTIHQVDEHVPVSDLLQLTSIYERFIAGYFAAAS